MPEKSGSGVSGFLRHIHAVAARPAQPWLRVCVSPRLARILAAGGAAVRQDADGKEAKDDHRNGDS